MEGADDGQIGGGIVAQVPRYEEWVKKSAE